MADSQSVARRRVAHRLATITWALFFIWVGAAFLLKIGIGVGLLGLGIIMLVMQVLRGINRVGLEWFWIGIGTLFLLGGIWELSEPRIPLVPILLIVAGILLLLSVTIGKQQGT